MQAYDEYLCMCVFVLYFVFEKKKKKESKNIISIDNLGIENKQKPLSNITCENVLNKGNFRYI